MFLNEIKENEDRVSAFTAALLLSTPLHLPVILLAWQDVRLA
jgi:hypothetical protein